jgi:hypothetical protein
VALPPIADDEFHAEGATYVDLAGLN